MFSEGMFETKINRNNISFAESDVIFVADFLLMNIREELNYQLKHFLNLRPLKLINLSQVNCHTSTYNKVLINYGFSLILLV